MSEKINDGGAAFPRPIGQADGIETALGGTRGEYNRAQAGMTYRQWLAGMALQGILANPEPIEITVDDRNAGRDVYKIIVELAVKYADAMLKEQEAQS